MTIETKFNIDQNATHKESGKSVIVDSITYDSILGYWVHFVDDPTKKFWCKENVLTNI